jgi:hypothetical protein
MTIGLFEVTKNIGQALARNLTKLLDKYGLKKKIIANVKNEGSNFNAMTTILKFIENCESLGLKKNFQGACFEHVFSKACQYGIVE